MIHVTERTLDDLGSVRNTEVERRSAALTVLGQAEDIADARELLQALGLTDATEARAS